MPKPKQVHEKKMNASHKWTFKTRFRSRAYGWRASALASKRLKEAVHEIKKAAKSDPVLAGDGVVTLLERIWPSLQGIDTSSGALGSAVNRTLEELIAILVDAPADLPTRQKWLDRLYDAVAEDGVEYLAPVEDRWGDICVFPELANRWADHMIPAVREGWEGDRKGTWVVGATLCLSCLVKTERFQELRVLLSLRSLRSWHFDKFWAQAIAYAEGCRSDQCDDHGLIPFCERVLLEAGRRDEAYRRYGLTAATATTNLAVFKETARKYPEREPRRILLDLIKARGDTGKWFAAAKDAGFLDLALECASSSSADPSTLTRAARDFMDRDPQFAAQVALHALDHLLAGGGYNPKTIESLYAYEHLMTAANKLGNREWARAKVQALLTRGCPPDRNDMHRLVSGQLQREAR